MKKNILLGLMEKKISVRGYVSCINGLFFLGKVLNVSTFSFLILYLAKSFGVDNVLLQGLFFCSGLFIFISCFNLLLCALDAGSGLRMIIKNIILEPEKTYNLSQKKKFPESELFKCMLDGFTRKDLENNMDRIIIYSAEKGLYGALEEYFDKLKIKKEHEYSVLAKNKLLINFLKDLDVEKRLNIYFSKSFQNTMDSEMSDSYIFDIKRHVMLDSIQEYVDKDLSGYDNELYAIAQEVDSDKKSLYVLSQKMKKELVRDRTVESDYSDLVSDLNKLKNESILKF